MDSADFHDEVGSPVYRSAERRELCSSAETPLEEGEKNEMWTCTAMMSSPPPFAWVRLSLKEIDPTLHTTPRLLLFPLEVARFRMSFNEETFESFQNEPQRRRYGKTAISLLRQRKKLMADMELTKKVYESIDTLSEKKALHEIKNIRKDKESRIFNEKAKVVSLAEVQATYGVVLESLRLEVGVVSRRQKKETLKVWRRLNKAVHGGDGKLLIAIARNFLGISCSSENGTNLPFDMICEAVIEIIPHDSWMRFVRLKLELEENVIKALHHKYAELSEEQMYQILKELKEDRPT